MYVILGGTGQVGAATARALLNAGNEVTIVTRDESHGEKLKKGGARIAQADIRDVEALHRIFQTGRRAFLLNPPADPSGDTDQEERENVAAILAALQGSGLEKVVAQSTYGAFDGERCGDLTVLYEFEQALMNQPIPAAINRGAYYMSNWAGMIQPVKDGGVLPSFFPADFVLPMVAPADLGKAAAKRVMSAIDDIGIAHIEGPTPYTANDVATAFARILDREVVVEEVPREALEDTFRQLGFSDIAAQSYACMTRRMIDGLTGTASDPIKGSTTMEAYFASIMG